MCWGQMFFSAIHIHYCQESLVTVLGESISYALLCCAPDSQEESFAPAIYSAVSPWTMKQRGLCFCLSVSNRWWEFTSKYYHNMFFGFLMYI